MRVEKWFCPLCSWTHEEVDALTAMPAALFGSFSDPAALAAIMARQKRERVYKAMRDHLPAHTIEQLSEYLALVAIDEQRGAEQQSPPPSEGKP